MAKKPAAPKVTFSVGATPKALARLRELILHIAARCDGAEYFGAIKLNKILALADFTSFVRHGTPITGVEYMRERNGPVPRKMKPLITKMERDRTIVIQKRPLGGHIEHRVIPIQPANLSIFSAREIAIVDEVIAARWSDTGTQMSEFSHGRAWQAAGENGELIPYEAAYLSDRPVSAADVAMTKELNAKYSWE